jgi:hypothetical protein
MSASDFKWHMENAFQPEWREVYPLLGGKADIAIRPHHVRF